MSNYPQPERKSARRLADARLNKNNAFREFFEKNPMSWDHALPQTWLDNLADWCKENRPEVTYHLISSTTVWAYPPRRYGGVPFTICEEVYEAMTAHANSVPF